MPVRHNDTAFLHVPLYVNTVTVNTAPYSLFAKSTDAWIFALAEPAASPLFGPVQPVSQSFGWQVTVVSKDATPLGTPGSYVLSPLVLMMQMHSGSVCVFHVPFHQLPPGLL